MASRNVWTASSPAYSSLPTNFALLDVNTPSLPPLFTSVSKNSGLAQVAVTYTIGLKSGFAALTLPSSVMNAPHWAPSGTARIASGLACTRLVICPLGAPESAGSMTSSATISRPFSAARSVKLFA